MNIEELHVSSIYFYSSADEICFVYPLCEKHIFKWLLGLSFVEFKTLKKRERNSRWLPNGKDVKLPSWVPLCTNLIYGLVSFSVSPQKFQRCGVIPELAILDINTNEEERTHTHTHLVSRNRCHLWAGVYPTPQWGRTIPVQGERDIKLNNGLR